MLHLFVDISGANVDNSAKGKLDLVGRSGLQSDSSSFIPALLSGPLRVQHSNVAVLCAIN